MKIENQRILITGAAGGIGQHLSRMAGKGNELFLIDLNQNALDKVALELENLGAKVHTFAIDITDRKVVEKLAGDIIKSGGLDLLINNAGIGLHKELSELTIEDYEKQLAVNFWAPLYFIYAFLPYFKEHKKGHIVNVSSGQAFYRLPTWSAYAVVKLAIGALSEALHFELKNFNIKVTTVYPYMVNTGFYNDVKTETLASKLSMALLPLYSQEPETVARTIINAIEKERLVEDVHILTSLGRLMRGFQPVTELVTSATAFFMTKNGDENDMFNQVSQKLAQLVDGTGSITFKMDELMSGEHEFIGGAGPEGKRPFYFEATWGPKSFVEFLNPTGNEFMLNNLEGTVTIDGMGKDIPCSGSLQMKYFDEYKIVYNFDFTHDKKEYHYIGEKVDIKPWNLHLSHTTCFGEVKEKASGKVISKSITHFHWHTLPDFLKSFRIEAATA